MTPELRFEHRFTDLYHAKYGGKSYHADFLAPGFPDRIFYPVGAESQLVEFKVCNTLDDPCSKVFETTQPSFYADFLRDETKRIFVVFKLKKSKSYVAVDMKQRIAINMSILCISDILTYHSPNIDDVVEWVFMAGSGIYL